MGARHLWPISAVLLLGGLLAAQPPARTALPFEEELADPPKDLRPLELDDDIADTLAAQGTYYVRLPGVVRRRELSRHPETKAWLAPFRVAFDRFVYARTPPIRIAPLPRRWGADKDKFPDEFGVVPFDADDRPGEVSLQKGADKGIVRIEPFEQVALNESARWLQGEGKPGGPPPIEKLFAAEAVLAEALRFHEGALKAERRLGAHWGQYEGELSNRLREVRADALLAAAKANDWPTVRRLGADWAELYRSEPKALEKLFAARFAEAETTLTGGRAEELPRLRDVLRDYETRLPGRPDPAAARLRLGLDARAKALLAEAERLAPTAPTQARALLQAAEAAAPDLAGVRDKQRELKGSYSILVVGARDLPDRMSPAAARLDSEKQAAALMFEGLLESFPDDALGTRFAPGLGRDRPRVGPGTRDVALVSGAEWAAPGGGVGSADPLDVAETLQEMRARPETWAGAPALWLGEPAGDPADPARLRLTLRAGHPDPRSLLTFPVLPGRWLAGRGKASTDPEFSRRPFGTGPFRLAPGYVPPGLTEKRPEVVFVANPGYSRRPGKIGQPFLREVRFADLAALGDLPAAFRGERLHLLPDVPTAELPKFQADGGLNGKVRVFTAAQNRRVHILLANHRKPALQSLDLRQGVSLAIDRDKILTDLFRAGQPDVHRPLGGPFPPNSWAVPRGSPGLSAVRVDRDLAAGKLRKFREARPETSFSLVLPANDPAAAAACEAIRQAIAATDSGVTLQLEPLPARDFHRRIEEEQAFDFAYVAWDYPDDWFPVALALLLDPDAAGPGGRNAAGYGAPGTNPTPADARLGELLQSARTARDATGRLTPLAYQIHEQFGRTLPFVPLWQLDRHVVAATALKVVYDGRADEISPRWLDPTRLFDGAGRWRLE